MRFAAKVYGKDSMIKALQAIDRWVNRAPVRVLDPGRLGHDEDLRQHIRIYALAGDPSSIEERVAALERLA